MMRSLDLFAALAACALVASPLLLASPGRAQSMDYGALEEIFGQPVTTSATGKPQKASEVPVNMEIITQDDIRRSGADTIPDVLQFMTGINFRRSSVNDPEISIRGYDQPWNPRLLVLVNGQPVYEDFFGDVVWPLVPVQLDEIRQIEVVKGPNAALFGFNATSGVVNIITFDPLHDETNVATARTGTQSLAEGSAVATLQAPGQYGIRLSAGGMQSREYGTNDLQQSGAPAYLKPQTANVNFDARWAVADDAVLSLNGNSGAMNRNLPGDLQAETDRTWSLRGRLVATTAIGITDFDVYWTRWRFDFPYLQQAQSTTRDVRLSDLFKLGTDHSIRLSAEYKYNDADGEFFNSSTEFYSIYSAGAMWGWDISKQVSITNAVREDYLVLGMTGSLSPDTHLIASDYNHRTIDTTSFNSGIVYRVTDADTLRATASRGYQLPSLNVLGQQIEQGGHAVFAGNPTTTATEVTNYEVDYDRILGPAFGVLRLAAFHQTNESLFGFLIIAPQSLAAGSLQSANIGDSIENGLEISLKSTPQKPVRWSLGYAYATISDHMKTSGGTLLIEPFSTFKDGTPENTISAGLGYSTGPWEFDTQGRWQSHYQDWQFSQATYLYVPVSNNAYFTMNGRIGYKLTDHLTLAVTGEQLTRDALFERASALAVDRRIFGSLSARF